MTIIDPKSAELDSSARRCAALCGLASCKPVDRTPCLVSAPGRPLHAGIPRRPQAPHIGRDLQAARIGVRGDPTAAEKLGVDAAIIFADLLLLLEPMGLPFEPQAGEGPAVHQLVRTRRRRARAPHRSPLDLAYVARAIEKVAAYFKDRSIPSSVFCGSALHPGQLHDRRWWLTQLHPHQAHDVQRHALWRLLPDKIVKVLEEYCLLQVPPVPT